MGVVGAIVPWNFPLLMAAWKIGPVLASGNSLVLKPSEKSPLTAMRIAELAIEAGLPEGVFNVVPGFGHTAGKALALSHGRRLHRVHRLDRHRQDGDAVRRRSRTSRRSRSSAAASRPTSCWRIARISTRRRPRRRTPSSSTRARCARPARACWCEASIKDAMLEKIAAVGRDDDARAIRSIRPRSSAPSSTKRR